ncbi:MAG: DUF6491 family protein [Sphingomonadales bacterium]
MKSLALRLGSGVCLAFAIALGAAADEGSGQEKSPHARDKLPPITQECMFFNTIYDWRALDPYNLIVWFNNRNTPRHLELETACYSARFVDAIAFTSNRDGRLCAFGGDSVVIGDMNCAIGAMHKITPEQADELVAEFKKRRTKKSD